MSGMLYTGEGYPTSVKLVDTAKNDSPAENLEMKRYVA